MRTFFQKGRTWMAALACALILTSCMEDEIVNPVGESSLDARMTTTGSASVIVGLSSNNELYSIAATSPASVTAITPIAGLKAGEKILAIDFNPANGRLYGLASTGLLYSIDRNTGLATAVSQTPMELAGTQFGFDFNPKTGMISVVSNKGQHIIVNPNGGAVLSTTWSTNPSAMINSIAYMSASTTTAGAVMYDISGADYKLYAQDIKTGMLKPIGTTGLIINGDGGFDISRNGAAFAIYTAKSDSTHMAPHFSTTPEDLSQETSRLYSINLRTGVATSYGKVGNGLIGVAVM